MNEVTTKAKTQLKKRNPERVREYSKEYYEKNKVAIAERNKEYRESHKEDKAARDKQYYEAHKELINNYTFNANYKDWKALSKFELPVFVPGC